MSRTVRRGARYRPAPSAKWYNNYLSDADLLILRKRPRPRQKNLFRWVWVEGHWLQKKEPYTYTSLYNGKVYTGYHTTRWYFETDETKPIPKGYEREWTPGGKKTKHRIKEYYPGLDQDSNNEYDDWLRAHKEVYRNESCVRCRRKNVRLSKQSDSQVERTNTRSYVRKMIADHYMNYEGEEMPSASTCPNRRFYANPHYKHDSYSDI